MKKCPKCGNDLLVTIFTNDNNGDDIVIIYTCECCKVKLNEEDVLNLLENQTKESEYSL